MPVTFCSLVQPDQSAVDECSRHTIVSALPPECSTGAQQQYRSVVAALTVWKLSQYLSKSRNFGNLVAVLAMLCVSALLCPQQSQLRYDMIRSRFQHSFVTQSVLHSYLVGFSASVPSLKCAQAWGMSSMSSCLFVCQFVHHFLAFCTFKAFSRALYTLNRIRSGGKSSL